MASLSAPPTTGRALMLRGSRAAAGVRVVLLQGTAAARALLLGGAAPGRVALVAFGGAAAASPRHPRCTAGGGNQPSDDDDAAEAKVLGEILQEVSLGVVVQGDDDAAAAEAKVSGEMLQEVCLGVVVQGDEDLLGRLATTSKEAGELLASMIKDSSSPLPDHVHQELIMLSTTFTELEGHCELAGYVTDTSVVAATEGVKRMAEIFLGSAAAENLGAFPKIANLVGEGSSQETKVGYLRQLAVAFSLLLAAVNSAYLRRPAAEAKVSGEMLQEVCLVVVVQGDDELLRSLATTSKEAGELLASMIKDSSSPLPDHVHQEIVLLRTTFADLEGTCELSGYVTDASVVAATRSVKRMAQIFLGKATAEDLVAMSPRIANRLRTGASTESKAAYLRQLALAFALLLRAVNTGYQLCRPGRD